MICGAKPIGLDTENKTRRRWSSKGVKMEVCRKNKSLRLMSVRDCENKRVDKGGAKMRELVMQSMKDRH